VTRIPITPLRRLRRLSGSFDSFLESGAYADAREDYLEIALEDLRLTENPLVLLRERFPYLLSVKQDAALQAVRAGESASRPYSAPAANHRRGAGEDFETFLTDLYGQADAEEVELFRTIAREADDAAS
jgi:exonuclease SbcD